MKKEEMKTAELYTLEHTMAKSLLEQFEYPWQALEHIGEFVENLGKTLSEEEYDNPVPGVWIHRTAKVAPTAGIMGPVVIGPGAEIRHCAFIRGKVLIGANSVVGIRSCLTTYRFRITIMWEIRFLDTSPTWVQVRSLQM